MDISLYEEWNEGGEEGVFSNMRMNFKGLFFVCLFVFPLSFCNYRYIAKHGSSSQYNHQGPFSQMVTPVSPQNSFNKTQRETITV